MLACERAAGALEGARDGVVAGLEQLGDLGDGRVEHVLEDDRDALAGGQELHRGDEREADLLALGDLLGRPGARRRERVEELVGVGLEVAVRRGG